jgi:hypothetical protein
MTKLIFALLVNLLVIFLVRVGLGLMGGHKRRGKKAL